LDNSRQYAAYLHFRGIIANAMPADKKSRVTPFEVNLSFRSQQNFAAASILADF
jgi:hypothetical protein